MGLESITHLGPSSVGIDTLLKSYGSIPKEFLSACGVPKSVMDYMPALAGSVQAVQFHSCFISYSHLDAEFVKRLHSRMRSEHIRVWYASEDIKGGQKIHDQIDEAIRIYDKLLLVLSEHSMQSEWVITEIRKARMSEVRDGTRKLFPIRLADIETIQAWECFDADSGKDLAVEAREYFIPDFSRWHDQNAFEKAFQRLLKDLTAE